MASKNRKLGVLVRGAGWVAGEHIKAFLKNPHTEIRHIDARSEHRIEDYFRKFGFRCDASCEEYEHALERDDIDIVSVCTINYQHAQEAALAAQAGKHVFIEKPIAINPREMYALEAALKKHKVKSAVGFVCHWYPRIVSMKAQVDKGALGKIFYANAAYLHELKGAWKTRPETAGSSLLMGGCHALDLVRWFLGNEKRIVEVHAYANGPWRRKDFAYPPNVFVSMKYEDGTVAQVGSSVECNMPYAFELTLLGTRGGIRGEKLYSEDFPGAKQFLTVPGVGMDSGDVAHHPFDAMLDEFVAWVRGGKPCANSTLDAVKTHEAIFAAQESFKTGKPVRLGKR
ncbi:MAG: Gfo/Idh/MocA family oxidoreductase [Planctomycetes bacterium]|nr:Gfo/Idh/MocA family oxidoreductase [Planctomycetota bacterium]